MPLVNGKNVTPDEDLAQGLCPECGGDFKVSNPIAHLNDHWKTMPKNDRRGVEGLRRRKLLTDYIAEHHVTTDDPRTPKEPAKPVTASAETTAVKE